MRNTGKGKPRGMLILARMLEGRDKEIQNILVSRDKFGQTIWILTIIY